MTLGKAIQMGFDWLRRALHLRQRLIKFLNQTEAQKLWIFQVYGCYSLFSTPNFVPIHSLDKSNVMSSKKCSYLLSLQASLFNWKGVRCVALDPRIMLSLLEEFGDITFLIPTKAYLRAGL